MRRDHEIVVFDHQIVNRRLRQVQLQRLPMRAVIERNENAKLGARVKQAAFLRIFAHCVHVGAIRNSADDRRSRFCRDRSS